MDWSKFLGQTGMSALIVMALVLSGLSAEYYQWIDENGAIQFSDSLQKVPLKYRDQVRKGDLGTANEPPSLDGSAIDSTDSPEAHLEDNQRGSTARHEVPYEAYGEYGERRIIIHVTFNGSITAPMALDTGATGLVLWSALATRLGIFKKGHAKLLVRAGGIGGSVPAHRTFINTVEVGGARSEFVPAKVIEGIATSFEGLVGMDFMDNYSLHINTEKKLLVFEENPRKRAMPGGHAENWWRSIFREFAYYRTQWRDYQAAVEAYIKSNSMDIQAAGIEPRELQAVVDFQSKEAGRLYDELHQFAVRNAVPMHWREF